MAYLQPQDTEVERQYLEKSSEIKQIETPQIESSNTVQPDALEKNSSDSEDTADMNPGVSHSDTPLEYIHRRIKEIVLKKIEIV